MELFQEIFFSALLHLTKKMLFPIPIKKGFFTPNQGFELFWKV